MLAKQRTHVDVYIQRKIQSRKHHTLQNYELTWTIQQEHPNNRANAKQNRRGINNIAPFRRTGGTQM